MAGRILGMGDVVSLVEKAQEAFDEDEQAKLQEKMAKGSFTLTDSKSTTPSGAIVALNAFDPGRTILLAGGYDKQSPFDELATVAANRAKAVIAFGQTAPKIVAAIESQSSRDGFATEVADLLSAIALAQGMSAPGDVIVLSPACASYDQFTNYEQRGDQFAVCVSPPSSR